MIFADILDPKTLLCQILHFFYFFAVARHLWFNYSTIFVLINYQAWSLTSSNILSISTPTPERVLRRSWDRRSLMSGGKSLALFEVGVAEVGTCLTLWATDGLATIPANSGPIKSSRDSSVANGSDSCKEKKY